MKKSTALDRVRVVLSHPSHPGNIGAAARAMKTMGLSRLYLVNPRRFPDPEAVTRSSGAADVLENATVCGSLEEALGGTVLAAALTSRRRDLSLPPLTLREAAPKLLAEAQDHEVAVVFGAETSGLTNAELDCCQMLLSIPANPEYASLNLAAAVQVVTYELRTATASEAPPTETGNLATLEEIEGFYGHLEEVMIAASFLDPASPKRLMHRLRRLYARTRLEREEVNILRGILKSLDPRRKS
ncbi:MAG: RNA methyltransferase [Sulfuricella sp.]|nr:RNA methyltransferase [Sulfuricella sp.]